jgi:threonine/homoserine/homoserine lactone efflux protein
MLLLFVLVCGISFAGSIHPGPVNLAVIQTTLAQSRRAGLWLALGGSLPEIAYSGLAAGGLMYIPLSSGWSIALTYAPIPVLLGAGVAAFRPTSGPGTVPPKSSVGHPFWKGLALGGTNPQLLPFWSAVWLYLNQATLGRHRLATASPYSSQVVFALGTAAGAFVLLALVVWLADRQREHIGRYLNGPWIRRLTGSLFLGMAVWHTVQLLTA